MPYLIGTNPEQVPVNGMLGTAAFMDASALLAAVSGSIARSTKTGAHTLTGADKGALIDCTGTWTLGFDAAATLGAGWWCYVRNEGTGDITLDPNSAETIDGLANFVLYPGAVRLVLCDGAALYSVPLVGGSKTFTITGSYQWAPGIQSWLADAVAAGGGGGGGGRATDRSNGGGGGAGERIQKRIFKAEVTAGGTTTCTVGAKGLGGAAAASDNTAGVNGTLGGDTSIGTLVVAHAGPSGGYNGTIGGVNGTGRRGGGSTYPNTAGGLQGQAADDNVTSASSTPMATEWGGPNGRAGDDTSTTGIVATMAGTAGGRGGASFAAGTAGNNGVNPGDGGDGGAGNLNGSPAGKGGDGADGKITIVEVI